MNIFAQLWQEIGFYSLIVIGGIVVIGLFIFILIKLFKKKK